jgi:hypothetical protein
MNDATTPTTREEIQAASRETLERFEIYREGVTFEEYAAESGMTEEDPRYEEIRDWWLRDQLAHRLAPPNSELPACPSWCSLPTQHRIESNHFDDATFLDTHEVTFSRIHSGHRVVTDGEQYEWASITQEEFWTRGEVTYGPVQVSLYHEDGFDELGETAARERAAQMRARADQLDGLADTLRTLTTEG